MNNAIVLRRYPEKSIEDYSDIIFSRVFYDNDMPITHLMSMHEALRQRERDRLEIMLLTEKAKKTLGKINRE